MQMEYEKSLKRIFLSKAQNEPSVDFNIELVSPYSS